MFRQNKLFTLIMLIAIIALAITSCGNAENKGTLRSEIYIVKAGDTLWDISAKYMERNTYGKRDIREFYHGIIENNYDSVFKDRKGCEIYPGDKLVITWWEKG